jgi:hypothetical protein
LPAAMMATATFDLVSVLTLGVLPGLRIRKPP